MIKTGQQYREDMAKLRPNVYMLGEKVENINVDPRFASTINLVARNHDICFDEELKHLAVAYEPFVGEEVRRFTHLIQRTQEDSIAKVQLTREVSARQICGWCMSNSMNIVWATTWETDQKHGTKYHERFQEFVKHLMKNDYDCFWAMMDPKGDRSKNFANQKNPVGVRLVSKDEKGIVVNGVKVSTSYAACSPYIFAVPCNNLTEEEKDYAVAFAVPIDAPGLTFVTRKPPLRQDPDNDMECPIGTEIGVVEGMTIFDNVFIPWERVFMCGEYDMAGRIPDFFASLQRQSKCSCLAGHTDLVTGVCALVADVNGLGMKPAHIKEKITGLMVQAEAAHGCALGAAAQGELHPSGVFMPSTLTANAGLNMIKNSAGEHIQLIHDIAGGIIVTMPTQSDYKNPEIKEWMDTYLAGSEKYTTEERLRVLNLAREIGASDFTGYFLGWAINASGSPMTNHVYVRQHFDLAKRVNIAKSWAKID